MSDRIWFIWVCHLRGHSWKRYQRNFHTCTRCGEPGWEV